MALTLRILSLLTEKKICRTESNICFMRLWLTWTDDEQGFDIRKFAATYLCHPSNSLQKYLSAEIYLRSSKLDFDTLYIQRPWNRTFSYPQTPSFGIVDVLYIKLEHCITKIWKQFKCLSTNKWITRVNIYAYNGILFTLKKGRKSKYGITESNRRHQAK